MRTANRVHTPCSLKNNGMNLLISPPDATRSAEPRPTARVLALLLFGASATNQLFFGYVENYTLVTAFGLVYILLAERTLSGRLSATVPAFAGSYSVHPCTPTATSL